MVALPFSLNYGLQTSPSSIFGTAISLRLNSIYDPEVTPLSLTSPYGYSALAAIWRNYRVHFVDIDLYFSDPSADGMWVAAGLYASNQTPNISGASLTTIDQKQMVDMRALNNTGSQSVRITRRVRIWEIEGMSRAQWIADPNFAAAFGTNPANYPVVNLASCSWVSGTPTVNVMIRITYHVEVYGLIAQ
jgi:hypothetical protein